MTAKVVKRVLNIYLSFLFLFFFDFDKKKKDDAFFLRTSIIIFQDL